MPELQAALDVALQATAAARTILLAECARPDGPRGEIGHCPADDEAELTIRAILERAFPDWGYLGEETGARPARDAHFTTWFVDPNDGTTTMQRGYRGHAISIGLVCDGQPVLGVVCAVDAPDDDGDLIAWAQGCGPIRRNGQPLPVQQWAENLRPDDIVGLSQAGNRNPVGHLACVAPARYVSSPSIAYRLALVAAGEHVATVSLNYLHPWDYAAGHALVLAAGGAVVDGHGQPLTYQWHVEEDQGQPLAYPAHGPETDSQVFAGHARVARGLVTRHWEGITRSGFGDAAPPPDLAPVRAQVGKLVHDPGTLSRAQGCLIGQFAGDALGALVEFQSAEHIAARYPDGGPRELAAGGPHAIIAGQPTDDSELALVLARSLVAHSGFDQEAVGAAYAGWYHGWTHTLEPRTCDHPWCRPFDVGGTTARALGAVDAADVLDGRAAQRARAAANKESQANGALMRVSPLGVWGALRDPVVVDEAARQDAQLTHPHPLCQTASALFAVTLGAAIRERLNPMTTHAFALEWLRQHASQSDLVRVVQVAADEPPADYLTQQGWVLIALHNAFFQLLNAPSFEAGLVATVRKGGDTDTNAAICGALLGAVYGRSAIPDQWQHMVLSCRPMPGQPGVHQPRPAVYWPTDALVLAERLVLG
ncbi:MAG: ADP-ribosylglycohydrolase family protein [Chloroflexi bacterium]|nr:ADP-ribosylglycohydrolase family protein [Chloroflexota bacterium]